MASSSAVLPPPKSVGKICEQTLQTARAERGPYGSFAFKSVTVKNLVTIGSEKHERGLPCGRQFRVYFTFLPKNMHNLYRSAQKRNNTPSNLSLGPQSLDRFFSLDFLAFSARKQILDYLQEL